MRLLPRLLTALSLAAVSSIPAIARADSLEASSLRALGMGGASRGAAAGSDAPFANPSGLSVLREYVMEAGYAYTPDEAAHVAHLVLADNRTSWLGAAPAYTYVRAAPDSAASTRRHELALALSAAVAGKLMLGATGKYLWIHDELPAGPLPTDVAIERDNKGFTYDVGLTLEASPAVHIGAVGYNLRDLHTPHARRGVGGGLALTPGASLMVAADTVVTFKSTDGRENVASYLGGAEYQVLEWLALRAGGGYDGLRESGYVSGGLSALSVERGGADVTGASLDFGFRQDVSGKTQVTTFGVALRIFIPVAEAP
jgi:hypothetical protein